MLYRKQDNKKLLKAGAFLIFLTIVSMVMILSIGQQNSFFHPKVIIKARVSNVANLQQGAYVDLRGIKIGTVEMIEIVSDEEVEISMNVLSEQVKWIKKDAMIAISNAGLVGDKFLEIIPGSKDTPSFDPKSDILKTQKKEIFSDLVNKGSTIAESTEKILNRIEGLLTSEQFETLINSLAQTSSHLEKITSDMSKLSLNQSVSNLNRTTARVDKILGQIETGPGSLHSLIYDESVHEDLRALLGGAQRNKVIKYFIRDSIKKSEMKD